MNKETLTLNLNDLDETLELEADDQEDQDNDLNDQNNDDLGSQDNDEDQEGQDDKDQDEDEDENEEHEEHEDEVKIALQKKEEQIKQLQKTIEKLKYKKHKAIQNRSNDVEDIEAKVEAIWERKEQEKELINLYPDANLKEVKQFSKEKGLTLLQAYSALNVGKKPKTMGIPGRDRKANVIGEPKTLADMYKK